MFKSSDWRLIDQFFGLIINTFLEITSIVKYFGLSFKGKVKARSMQGQGKVEARLGKGQGKGKARARQGHGNVKASSRQDQGKFMARSRRGLGKLKARSRGKFNNSNSFNEYQINFYRPQLTPYEQLQQ